MRTEVHKVLSMKKFFEVIPSKDVVRYIVKNPTKILMHNIHSNWLKFIYSKTSKHMPVFVNEHYIQKKSDILPFGFLKHHVPNYSENIIVDKEVFENDPAVQTTLNFNIIIAKQDVMQYFIQWQRYRKFWWSSITTTPSLFTVDDIKYDNDSATVNIVAQFSWGKEPVETLAFKPYDMMDRNTSCLTCTMSLERALFTLLLDGLTNQNKEEYLRLHRRMAPYKISFASDCEGSKNKQTLCDLATLLHLNLKRKRISTWLPNWCLSLDDQIKENLQMGVTYTAILEDTTLENGIFQLMNSSTMLMEQVHVADFNSYAALLCGK